MARHSYPFPRPALTVDAVLFALGPDGLELLLIERARDPFAGCWALPGGFVDQDEDLEVAARRELEEETGLRSGALHQVAAFGAPGRDPRGHCVSVAFVGAGRRAGLARRLRAGDDARAARLFPVAGLPALAFDHADIIAASRTRAAGIAGAEPLVFGLLPRRFSAVELRAALTAVHGRGPTPAALSRLLESRPYVVPVEGADGAPRFTYSAAAFRRSRRERAKGATLRFLP